jgi:hypothetical protein
MKIIPFGWNFNQKEIATNYKKIKSKWIRQFLFLFFVKYVAL